MPGNVGLTRALTLWVGVSVLPLAAPLPTLAQATSTAERIRLVENGLLPSVQVRGRTYPLVAITDRMQQLGVPAVSIAVIHDGELEWARAYGMADVAARTPATPATLFQAASMSKPVAAMGALQLVQEGRLALDQDVNTWLRSWQVPRDSFTAQQPVTLRHLLTHSAGLTVHGFPGYARGAPLPAVWQILKGEPPANTPPVRADRVPGTLWRYSGGGITVMQQLVQDVTLEPFPEFMQRAVLRPLGMTASTFEQPLPDALAARAATGYRSTGNAVAGRFHTYPELAAAGLWTTPSDLARWIMAVQSTFAAKSQRVLSPLLVTQMLRTGLGGWGLGVGLRAAGGEGIFEHGGANEGFRGQFFGFMQRGEGAVVMTNSDAGDRLVAEIMQALARAYRWPGFTAHEIIPTTVSPAVFGDYVGQYALPGTTIRVTVRAEGEALVITLPGGAESELVPVDRDWFAVAATADRLRFERGEAGRVVALRRGEDRLPRVD